MWIRSLAASSLLLLLTAAASAQAPAGYYDTVDTSSASNLRVTLHDVIDDHTRYNYTDSATDVWDILNLADEDPNDTGSIVDLYKNASYAKIAGGVGAYNREHSWPKSYGFPNDGSGNYPYTDCHHLFAADSSYNSSRSNKPFRNCTSGCDEKTTDVTDGRGGGSGVYPGNSNWTTGSFSAGTWETWNGRKGDVARAAFYMAIRYEGGFHSITGFAEPDLELTDNEALIDASNTGSNESTAYMGMLSVLLQWHKDDPVDSREIYRNEVVSSFQGNRNPFIDNPQWASCIWENQCDFDAVAPGAPTGLFASPGSSSASLSWNPNPESDLDGYRVYRATSASGPYSLAGTASGTFFTDNGLTNGTTYYWVVTAVDFSGNESPQSTSASATPDGSLDATPPAAPTGIGIAPGDGSVTLNWADNGEGDLDGYDVYRATSTGGPYTRLTASRLAASAYVDTAVTNGTTYFYVLTASDLTGNESAYSSEASATPQAGGGTPGGGLVLSEVLYDVSSTDTGYEWVELYNAGDTAIDLSGWSIGNGGTAYTYSLVQLSGTVAPGATFVVGGTLSSATNGNPIFDQAVDFNPDLQNSGTTADGVALFDVPATSVTAATVPVDAVVYGGSNASGLIDETGSANAPEVGDAGAGSSIERLDLDGNWQIQPSPTPNTSPIVAAPPSNTAPTVSITAPANGTTIDEGAALIFSGGATDSEDGVLSASITWSSSLDGALGTGASIGTTLSVGTHTITATVTDSGGLGATDQITVTVDPNTAPTVTITAPTDGSSVAAGTIVGLAGSAADAQDGNLSASLTWSSNLDGALGSGSAVNASLSVGTHTVTATVTDAGGLDGSDTITVTVTAANTAPTVTITAPADGSSVEDGTPFNFTGSASDTEDGDLSASIAWTSNLDGALGSGASVGASLSVGTHTITASVTDSGSLGGSDQIAVTVTAIAPATGDVILSEVLYDVDSTDDGLEWVELYNAGDAAVDLSGWSLGNGGTTWTTSTVQLSGTIQPGATFVVGGPTSSSLNGAPVFDLAVDFNPDLQNSGTTADGVALFNVPASALTGSSIPVDAVVYGGSNASGLVDETGSANAPEVGDAGPGSSIERTDLAGNWIVQGSPNPNTTSIGAPSNTAPTVAITAPSIGATFDEGAGITFTGSASDAEEGDLGASLSWSSDLDGAIGSGTAFTVTTLSVGTHTIAASVTDAGGLSGSDAITLTVNAVVGPTTVTFTSIGAEDGWVREASENSSVGGRAQSGSSNSTALRAGDDRKDRQYVTVLSFDTSSLPTNATITGVTLRLQQGQIVGTSPHITHLDAEVDVVTGTFGSASLEASDFEAPASISGTATLTPAAGNGSWAEGTFDGAGEASINTGGRTQVRVRFQLGDNDDRGNDYVGFYSGDDSSASRHPQLVVTYQ